GRRPSSRMSSVCITSCKMTPYPVAGKIWYLLLYHLPTPFHPREMQRVKRLRSSYESGESAGPRLLRSTRSASRRLCASAVNGGIRPSSGSMISDVRFNAFPVSLQNALYVPVSPALGAWSKLCRLASSIVSASSSDSVSRAASLPSSGRCSGVDVWLFHCPCRSGSPHGVRDGVQFFAAAALVALAAEVEL